MYVRSALFNTILIDNLKKIVPFDFQNHKFDYELKWSVISLLPKKQTLHLLNW